MKPHTFRFDYTASLNATITKMVELALAEDLNSLESGSDITAELIPEDQLVTASLICREEGILCGTRWVDEVFRQLDDALGEKVTISWRQADGDRLTPGLEICSLEGSARVILIGERTAMNFLQTLSGTATVTHRYVTELEGTGCRLLDTRKTIPGFRLAQKYAVTCGGGHNHRIGLFDAFLIKENHIIACGGIAKAIVQARLNHPEQPVEVEVESLSELEAALNAGADVIMLDNFGHDEMLAAVAYNNLNYNKLTYKKAQAALEASGNITLENLADVARTGVDYISVGAITKNIQALDLSLRIQM